MSARAFKQRTLTAAIKAVLATGQRVRCIDVAKDGGFTLTIGEPDQAEKTETPDDVKALI